MQTRITILAAACALAATSTVLAQEAPTPPTQVAKFGAVLGKWQGSGTTVPAADADPIPWTASMEVTRILDGFFVQEELEVDAGLPTPMKMRTIYAYDTENERYVAFSMSNGGPSHFGEYMFPERGLLMMQTAHVENGKPALARSMWRMGRDELTYQSQMAEGTGDLHAYVDGKFVRVDTLPKPTVAAAFMEAPVADEMTTLTRRMAGTYDLQGSMTMMPGMPEMKLTGTEHVSSEFGGHVLHSVLTGKAEGDDSDYRGETYVSWNAHDRCYDFVAFDNMGMVGKSQGRWAGDDEMVTSWSGLMMGQQSVSQGTVHFGEHGMSSVVMFSIVGSSEPMKSFAGTYQRRKD